MVKGSGKIKITNNKDNKQDSLLNNFLGVKLWLFTIQFREGGGGQTPELLPALLNFISPRLMEKIFC